MNVPGSNLLATALTVICPQPFEYFRYRGKTTNAIGLDVHTFDDAVTLMGSIQDIGTDVYQARGLDFQKQYIEIWVTTDTNGFQRGQASDQIGFNGRRWQIIDDSNWFPIDGWDSFIAVEVVTP